VVVPSLSKSDQREVDSRWMKMSCLLEWATVQSVEEQTGEEW